MLESLSFLMLICTALFFGFLYRLNRAGRREAAQHAGTDAPRAETPPDRDAA